MLKTARITISQAMECNRDEAIRAKTIAEGKLADKDFGGAKKFAMKAQTLYPGLDGLSQMFTTLDVYIAAENKISGEVDWYGILGVNPTADDETIRKQYRKLALVLHPDKNKCVGADGAFKLLSEAWSLLSDKSKRLQYNQRRSSKGFNLKIPTQNPPNGYHKFTSRPPHTKPVIHKNTAPPPTPPPSFRRTDTFWTICHQCKMHYEYLKIYLNNTLLCPNCHKAFVASEMAPPSNLSKPSNPSSHQRHQTSTNHVPGNNSTFDPGRKAAANQNPRQGGANSSKQANTQWGPSSRLHGAGSKETIAAKVANVIQQANEKLKREREESQAGGPGKKRRGVDDDGHVYGGRVPYQMAAGNGGGVSTGSVSGLKPGFETDRVYGSSTGLYSKPSSTRELTQLELRNMLMKKAQIEIRKKLNEWSTLAREREQAKEREKAKESRGEKGKNATDNNGNGESSSATKRADQANKTSPSTDKTDIKEPEPVSMNVPDPDFHDFDLDRSEASFQDNQVWAAYDNDDGMPRFYAIIHKVMSRKPFKMRISWLNSKATSEFGPLEWVSSGFYKTCGEFNVGKHEVNKSLNSFSHPVKWTKAPRGRVHICPKKGDVWALYRNWSPNWNALTADDEIHKYDMVKVLDDYTEERGVMVTPLVKVVGFKTVFHPHLDPEKVKRIPNKEMFRFSHQVPSYLLTGEEARNAPKGCLELDPAATPLELLQVITEANEPLLEVKEGKVEEKKGQNGPKIEKEEMGENGKNL